MKLYVGYDIREIKAYEVARKTARHFGLDPQPLYEHRLRMSGMLTRASDRRGQTWDFNSSAYQSTDFAIARFFVPLLAHSGWAMFVDADVVFMRDPRELLELADEEKAVMVVKHELDSVPSIKMDGQSQSWYPRKLWSSVMLWNCDHEANQRINLTMLNQWPGRDLHALKWLADEEIGDLPEEANWLVEMQPKPEKPIIAHFTLGGPWLPAWERRPHDDIWLGAAA